jgi:hypothetical protein
VEQCRNKIFTTKTASGILDASDLVVMQEKRVAPL